MLLVWELPPPITIPRVHSVIKYRIKFHCVSKFTLELFLYVCLVYPFFKIDFFLSANFFLLLFVTFDNIFSLIAIIMTRFFLIGIWFCLQESRHKLGMVTGRV